MEATPACPPASSRTAPYGPRSRSGAQALFSAPSPPLPGRKLAVFDAWSALAVHVAMDNTVVMADVSE